MKVLMFGWEFPPYHSGGLGVACQGLVDALVSKNIGVTFVLPKHTPVSHAHAKFLYAGVQLKFADTKLVAYGTVESLGLEEGDTYFGSGLFAEIMAYANQVPGIIRDEQFDVIHAHDWLTYMAGVRAKKVSGKKLILHVHATAYDQAGRQHVNPEQYAVERYGFMQADHIITVSHFVARTLMDEYGVPGDKITVVHNGVGCERTYTTIGFLEKKREEGYHTVLFLGRITIQKGPDYFVELAKRVLEYEPKTIFIMNGSGDMKFAMIRRVHELGLEKNFMFTDAWNEERNYLFRSVDVFVMPSVSEPFGLVPLEALLNGDTPVLISKQSGVSEVLTHALKVDFWDIDEMANKLIALLRNPHLHKQLTEYGKKDAEKVTWSRSADGCISVYNRCI